jgi:hypothetical protein
MHPTEIPDDLAFEIGVAANFYNMSRSAFIRHSIRKRLDQVADLSPILKAAMEMKR